MGETNRRARALAVVAVSLLATPVGSARAASAADRKACIASYEEMQVLMKRSRLLTAREKASACLANACPSTLRADCGQWLKEIDTRVPTVVVACQLRDGTLVGDVRVSLDGVPWKDHLDGTVSEVDPGEHVLRVERAQGPAVEKRVVFREGEKAQRVIIELPDGSPLARPPATQAPSSPPSPPPPPPTNDLPREAGRAAVPWTFYALTGAGVLAAGGFALFALMGKSGQNDLSTCAPHCAESAIGAVRARYITADIFLGLSVVALGAAAYALFSRGKAPPPARSRAAGGPLGEW